MYITLPITKEDYITYGYMPSAVGSEKSSVKIYIVHRNSCNCLSLEEPSHRVCKPVYLVPVLSQDKLRGLCQEGHPL